MILVFEWTTSKLDISAPKQNNLGMRLILGMSYFVCSAPPCVCLCQIIILKVTVVMVEYNWMNFIRKVNVGVISEMDQIVSTILSAYADWQPGKILREVRKLTLFDWKQPLQQSLNSLLPQNIHCTFTPTFSLFHPVTAGKEKKLLTPHYNILARFSWLLSCILAYARASAVMTVTFCRESEKQHQRSSISVGPW